MGHEPPLVLREHAEQVELDRGQVDRLAVAVTTRLSVEVDHQLADLELRAAAESTERRRSARSRASSSLGPERLGDVVVGAGIERSDLLALVPDRRQAPRIGRRLQRLTSSQISTPRPSGRTRSSTSASGGLDASSTSASALVSADSTV